MPQCTNARYGEVRLSHTTEGRVMICYEEEWKTVCDHGWGNKEAQVVCRQLGHHNPEQG